MQHCTVLQEMLLVSVQDAALVSLLVLVMLDSTVEASCSASRLIGVEPSHPSTLTDLHSPEVEVVQTSGFLNYVHWPQE